MAETATHQRFRSRLEYLLQHMQVVDVAISLAARQTKSQRSHGGTILSALGIVSGRYDRLNHPVKHDARIFNYSRSQNAEHALTALHRHSTEYLRGILGEMYSVNPLVVVGKAPGTFQFQELVRLGNFEAIGQSMIDSVFRKLENERSTPKLLEKLLNHTGVHLDPIQQENALMYLEMRHLIIHNNGRVDHTFANRYGGSISLREGDRLPMQARTVQSAVRAVSTLVGDIDTQLLAGNLVIAR